MPNVVASISAHGFGHMAISAPVLERLAELAPDCAVTVSSSIPEAALRRRIRRPFDLVSDPADFGLRMNRDLSVDVASTVADYAGLHRSWEAEVERRSEWLLRSGSSLVLSNVSYLNIAAADRAGVPAIALSPLNWADLYRYFAPDEPATRVVFEQMVDAYNRCRAFLAPEPCMPMPGFDNVEVIPPVVQIGRGKRDVINRIFGLDDSTRLLLLALGGQEAQIDIDDLPVIDGIRWLAEERWALERDDILPLDRTELLFPDLLASCDLLVAKPGYGAFAEAACLGKPLVYMRRPDWPEESYLIEWLQQKVPCLEATRGHPAGLRDAVLALLDGEAGRPCAAGGVDRCVERMLAYLR